MSTRLGAQHARILSEGLRTPPGQKAFEVQVVTTYRGEGQLLQWGHVPLLSPATFPDFRCLGRFACYRLERHDGGTLVEHMPEARVRKDVLEEVLDAFNTGIVQDKTVAALRDAVARAV